jgi:hypothetical protein
MENHEDLIYSPESYNIVRNLIKSNNLEKLEKMHRNGIFTRETETLLYIMAFYDACFYNRPKICRWFCKNFPIKEEIAGDNYDLFQLACERGHYDIISFLYNTFGITEEKVKHFIKRFPVKKQKKILDCLVPFGSFAEPAKK